jgi:hypothetical protein
MAPTWAIARAAGPAGGPRHDSSSPANAAAAAGIWTPPAGTSMNPTQPWPTSSGTATLMPIGGRPGSGSAGTATSARTQPPPRRGKNSRILVPSWRRTSKWPWITTSSPGQAAAGSMRVMRPSAHGRACPWRPRRAFQARGRCQRHTRTAVRRRPPPPGRRAVPARQGQDGPGAPGRHVVSGDWPSAGTEHEMGTRGSGRCGAPRGGSAAGYCRFLRRVDRRPAKVHVLGATRRRVQISMVAQRQGHGPQVLVKHYARSRPSADRKAAEHLGQVVHGLDRRANEPPAVS